MYDIRKVKKGIVSLIYQVNTVNNRVHFVVLWFRSTHTSHTQTRGAGICMI